VIRDEPQINESKARNNVAVVAAAAAVTERHKRTNKTCRHVNTSSIESMRVDRAILIERAHTHTHTHKVLIGGTLSLRWINETLLQESDGTRSNDNSNNDVIE
jgi:hypothetical protein